MQSVRSTVLLLGVAILAAPSTSRGQADDRAELRIDVRPDALIYLDGRLSGRGGLLTKVAPGEHLVRLDYYQSRTEKYVKEIKVRLEPRKRRQFFVDFTKQPAQVTEKKPDAK